MQRSTVRRAVAGSGGLLAPLAILFVITAAATPDEDCRQLGQGCSQSDCYTGNGGPDCDQDSGLVLPVTGGVPTIQ
ncbi:hypothetical protein [[Mycobacterium] wendilense]|uniref:EGF-like domain-containing protein n=1 Tax=[Mycobacterium] wendilense TaxID=3064284 RepID=A0ABN9NXH1_9MYCO|nr:hypothetical protein [Mycolicibacterium sp. MU0050]CAJ1582004.1 hypothetical protein MU0050_001845 [Mycolicibacterium sp. MU0050]